MPVIPTAAAEICEPRPKHFATATVCRDDAPVPGAVAGLPRPSVVVWFLVAIIVIHVLALTAS